MSNDISHLRFVFLLRIPTEQLSNATCLGGHIVPITIPFLRHLSLLVFLLSSSDLSSRKYLRAISVKVRDEATTRVCQLCDYVLSQCCRPLIQR